MTEKTNVAAPKQASQHQQWHAKERKSEAIEESCRDDDFTNVRFG